MGKRQETSPQARQRKDARDSSFERAKRLHMEYGRRSGCSAMGRDSKGVLVETRQVSDFGINIKKWWVRIVFKREDEEKIGGKDWQEVEATLKKGRLPREAVPLTTHILRAPRLMMHIQEGYQREIEASEALLEPLDALNVEASEIGSDLENKDIDRIIATLQGLDPILEGKTVAAKKIVGRGRLAKTVKAFEEAKERKGLAVAQACAVFTSLRNRIGPWRDSQIAGISEYAKPREYALRVERDQWLYSQLVRFAEDPEAFAKYQIYDNIRLEVINQIATMLKKRAPKEAVLLYIEATSGLFKVPDREAKKAEKAILMMEKGIMPKPEERFDFLIGYYRLLFIAVRDGDRAEARQRVEHARLFIHANKPRFIFDELSKNPDPYLGEVLAQMGKAVKALEAYAFEDSKKRFAEAAERLRQIIYPKGAADESKN